MPRGYKGHARQSSIAVALYRVHNLYSPYIVVTGVTLRCQHQTLGYRASILSRGVSVASDSHAQLVYVRSALSNALTLPFSLLIVSTYSSSSTLS